MVAPVLSPLSTQPTATPFALSTFDASGNLIDTLGSSSSSLAVPTAFESTASIASTSSLQNSQPSTYVAHITIPTPISTLINPTYWEISLPAGITYSSTAVQENQFAYTQSIPLPILSYSGQTVRAQVTDASWLSTTTVDVTLSLLNAPSLAASAAGICFKLAYTVASNQYVYFTACTQPVSNTQSAEFIDLQYEFDTRQLATTSTLSLSMTPHAHAQVRSITVLLPNELSIDAPSCALDSVPIPCSILQSEITIPSLALTSATSLIVIGLISTPSAHLPSYSPLAISTLDEQGQVMDRDSSIVVFS